MKRGSVELVYFEGCPNAEAARSSITGAFEEIGAEPEWVEWDVFADETPPRYRSYASPTVLVAGHDVLGGASGNEGVSCRAEGAPTAVQVLTALREER